jgi:hypothetical protein
MLLVMALLVGLLAIANVDGSSERMHATRAEGAHAQREPGGAVAVITPAPTTTTLSSLPATTTTVPVPSGVEPCTASQLEVALARDVGAAMQQAAAFFSVTNTASSACTTVGYPTVVVYDTAGQVISTPTREGSSYLVNDPGVHPVVVQPGQSVYFGLGWLDDENWDPTTGISVGVECTHVASVAVTPPGTDASLTTAAPLRSPFCPRSLASVTAIAAADSFTIATPVKAT